MDKSQLKIALLAHCNAELNKRLEKVKKLISNLQDSLTTETKSTAGDKHETGRAMVQLEREKMGIQLAAIQKSIRTLSRVVLDTNSNKIHLGSVVYTSQANYFVAISIGEVSFEDVSYYAIGAQTPIGKLLLGREKDEVFEFNGQQIAITAVF